MKTKIKPSSDKVYIIMILSKNVNILSFFGKCPIGGYEKCGSILKWLVFHILYIRHIYILKRLMKCFLHDNAIRM